MRIAVLGCGSIGCRHMRNLQALGESDLLAFDPEPDARRAAESDLQVPAFGALDEVWAREPRVVLITAPTSLHLDLALQGALRGFDLFVEKPLAHTEDGLDRLCEEVERRRLVTMVGCNMRFHPGPARVKKLLVEGAVGRPLFARVFAGSYLPNWRPWQDYRRSYSANAALGGGCILDGIHEIDLARWYLGDVSAVVALAGQVGDLQLNGVEDLASIVLQHDGGAQSEVHLDYLQRVRIRGCVIAGTEGTITWEWSDHSVRHYEPEGESWQEYALPSTWELNQMYVDEMSHFLESVRDRRPTCNPVAEAARVTRIALAAKRSSAERKCVALSGSEVAGAGG